MATKSRLDSLSQKNTNGPRGLVPQALLEHEKQKQREQQQPKEADVHRHAEHDREDDDEDDEGDGHSFGIPRNRRR
jgi:hypothetical protein